MNAYQKLLAALKDESVKFSWSCSEFVVDDEP